MKTPLKNKTANLYLQNFTYASARWLYWFHTKLSPHISQQNFAHAYMTTYIFVWVSAHGS